MYYWAKRKDDWRMYSGWFYGAGKDLTNLDIDSLCCYLKDSAEDSSCESFNFGQSLGKIMR